MTDAPASLPERLADAEGERDEPDYSWLTELANQKIGDVHLVETERYEALLAAEAELDKVHWFLRRCAISEITDEFEAMTVEGEALEARLAAAESAREAAVVERDEAIERAETAEFLQRAAQSTRDDFEAELERMKVMRKRLDHRIHMQRKAWRDTWEVVEMRMGVAARARDWRFGRKRHQEAKAAETQLSAALARAERAEKALEWQPIATAPKDNEDSILVCDARVFGGFHQVVWWSEGPRSAGYNWYTSDGPNFHKDAFTHWMPLPVEPAALAHLAPAEET